MATVNLPIRDSEYRELPPCCIVCGEPTNEYEPVPRTFLYYPKWIWLVFFLCGLLTIVVFLVVKRTRRVWTPLCEEHRNYWTIRNWAIAILWCSAVGGYFTTIVMKEFGASFEARIFTGVASLISVVLAALFLHRSVRASHIQNEYLTLENVHERFFEEWRDQLLDHQ